MSRFLKLTLPKLGLSFDCEPIITHYDGKRDLRLNIPRKLGRWRSDPDIEPRFMILQDKDDSDCLTLKQELTKICVSYKHQFLIRIVVQEMEAWLLGDLPAVGKASAKNLSGLRNKEKFRDPDAIVKPSKVLAELSGMTGKSERASQIAEHMIFADNTSKSFKVFCDGVKKLAQQ